MLDIVTEKSEKAAVTELNSFSLLYFVYRCKSVCRPTYACMFLSFCLCRLCFSLSVLPITSGIPSFSLACSFYFNTDTDWIHIFRDAHPLCVCIYIYNMSVMHSLLHILIIPPTSTQFINLLISTKCIIPPISAQFTFFA